MIVDLPDTTTSALSKALVKIREEGGAVALGHAGQEAGVGGSLGARRGRPAIGPAHPRQC